MVKSDAKGRSTILLSHRPFQIDESSVRVSQMRIKQYSAESYH